MRVLLLLFIWFGVCGAVRAQNAPDEKPKPIFPQLFPNPTGTNGYEELIMAGDLAQDSKLLNDAMQPGATLTLKRKALEDGDVRRALALIQMAFLKPIHSPRDPTKNTFDTAFFLDLAVFRNLARVFSIVEYVALADGKTGVALDAMDDCLQMSRAIPAESMINALVFVAVDAIAVKLVASHVSQLSFRDCERLELICNHWLRHTDSFASALAGERNLLMRQYKETTPKPNEILEKVNPAADDPGANDEDNPDATPEEKALKARLRDHPGDAKKLWEQALELIKTFYDAMIVEANKDAWERKLPDAPKAEPAVKAITDAVTPVFAQVLSKQDQDKANLHLLGTFAALQRYRWIHRHYPESLKELREPILTQDPFTGEFLIYKRDGDAYDLHSAGPIGAESKARTPLYLPYRKN